MEFKDVIQEGCYNACKEIFDFDNIFQFCLNHRVEIILQDDLQYHCFIDYKKGDGSYAQEIEAMSALTVGIFNYQNYH